VPKIDRDDVGLLVAIAALVARGDEALAKTAFESPLLGGRVAADVVAARLAELVAHVARGEIAALDRVLQFLCSTIPSGFESELRGAVLRALAKDPGDGAEYMLLGRLFERRGQAALARSAYSVAHFIDAGMGASGPLADLGSESKPRLEAFFLGSDAVHPQARGSSISPSRWSRLARPWRTRSVSCSPPRWRFASACSANCLRRPFRSCPTEKASM